MFGGKLQLKRQPLVGKVGVTIRIFEAIGFGSTNHKITKK